VTNVVVYTSLSQALNVETVCVDCPAEHDRNVKAVGGYNRRGSKDGQPR
jgi:hypothetical protein